MVNPIYIIAIGLGVAFLLGLLQARRIVSYTLTVAALLMMALIAAEWIWAFAFRDAQTAIFFTAGTAPPFAISLRMGLAEAVLCWLVSFCGFLSAIYLRDTLMKQGRRAMAVLVIFSMALCGLILTRDLFNLFVFIELMVIATGGLILLSRDPRALAAGFKYLIACQLISIMLLLGIIFAYHATGTLNIDDMITSVDLLAQGGGLAFFFLLMALVAELKPFPANGWALDIYESAHPAFSAMISAAMGSTALFVADKILMIGAQEWLPLVSGVGIVGFIGANLFALSQTTDRRLLGYSSVGQVSLVLLVIGQRDILGEHFLYIGGGILLAHALAKSGLFWLSGLVAGRELTAWSALRRQPFLIFAFASFLALLIGLPPFPGFYAKWELAHLLASHDRLPLLVLMLFGALLEASYLFRWFGYVIKREEDPAPVARSQHKLVVLTTVLAGSWGLGYVWGALSSHNNLLHTVPLLFALAFLALEWLPAKIKNTLAIAGLSGWFYMTWHSYDPLHLIFAIIMLLGGAVILLASYHAKGQRIGFYPSAMLMYAGLAMLITVEDNFNFFAAWESLTIGSYFLIMRGKASEPHALSYLIFSLGGAFLILIGFALAAAGDSQMALAQLSQVAAETAPWVFLLLAIGFMTKTAALGLHIWLPGAHAEAETDVSPMVSGILLKAGLFGLFILLMTMGRQTLHGVDLTYVMLWIGAFSALVGNIMAAFQEDAKRLLAYSSIAQMGYALFGLALMNHLGWLMALMFVINHYIYKSMLFLSVGGIAKRTGTRLMYQMGGLIALMPLSFVAVLIGIIAISGVPPLSGFGGRWIFYNAIISTEYRLPMIVVFLAGPIAFLYLFRLIHTIFLGQVKDENRRIKEAPFWILLPQGIFVVCLLGFALLPGMALSKVDGYISKFFPQHALNWEGLTITSSYGYWSPVSIMIVIGVIFVVLFAWLLLVNRKAQKVKQFNIVYSAERPFRPETTHFAWNFFAPYRKALGILSVPLFERFWGGITDLLLSSSEVMRRYYTGNGQTYVIQLLAFVVIIYLLKMGF
jgi:formate hydrogenlyase subunit 3/multisubunit Na+/H+ antiporter MnhD subunit